ncbi:MAG: metalloregulator ArsR/SmtB family transcription factor [Acidimicrobiia bacterium]|nr:metalloregulator ArsR/SmtB family transcription factor [Acidimicrobiia bacterium]
MSATDITCEAMASTAVAGLVELATSPPPDPGLEAALERIGDPTGETWLHLLGAAVDIDPPRTLPELVRSVGEMPAETFRRLLLGVDVWSWRSLIGRETIEAAAGGDVVAGRRLLDHDRYYGGRAAEALPTVLPLDAAETKRRFVDALEAATRAGLARDAEPLLGRTVADLARRADASGWIPAIEAVTGYRYVPEPEARRVVVAPHASGDDLHLAQHRWARLIVFGAGRPSAPDLADVGAALADGTRIALLEAIAGGTAELGGLVDHTGLARSTVHHHLRRLRAAGLVVVEGNARSYRYRIADPGPVLGALERLLTPDERTRP